MYLIAATADLADGSPLLGSYFVTRLTRPSTI